jgi:hypothetical protein
MIMCTVCGSKLDPVNPGQTTHPMCNKGFGEPYNEDPFSIKIKTALTEIIVWHDKQNPRGNQSTIGPSEIGDPCDRRIGYRLAQIAACNKDYDTWPSIVGTAIHTWLQTATEAWMAATGKRHWLTETVVEMDQLGPGHSDLYWAEEQCVIDHKTAGPDVFKKTKANGPAPGYIVQAHLYGYGFEQAGYPVKKVALAFFGRAGWLRDMYVWSADYDRSIAEAAMARVFKIAQECVTLDVLKQSHRWQQLEATPSNTCGFCPWYAPWKDDDAGADHTGCPGR